MYSWIFSDARYISNCMHFCILKSFKIHAQFHVTELTERESSSLCIFSRRWHITATMEKSYGVVLHARKALHLNNPKLPLLFTQSKMDLWIQKLTSLSKTEINSNWKTEGRSGKRILTGRQRKRPVTDLEPWVASHWLHKPPHWAVTWNS